MNKQNFLLNIYKDLQDSDYRQFIAQLYSFYTDKDSKVLDADYLLSRNKLSIEDNVESIDEIGDKDYRIKKLSLSNFRKFPSPKDKGQKYAVVFEKDSIPYSQYMTGANGTGKSSLFCALEYAYTGKVDGLDERQIVFGFARQKSIQRKDMTVILECMDNLCLTGNGAYPFPDAMFCSERDVTKEEICNTVDFVLKNLGFADLLQLENDIRKLKDNLAEKLRVCQATTPIVYNATEESDVINLLMLVYVKPSLRNILHTILTLCDEIIEGSINYLKNCTSEYPIAEYVVYTNLLRDKKNNLLKLVKNRNLKNLVINVCNSIKEGEQPETWMPEDFPRTDNELEVYGPALYLKSVLQKVDDRVQGQNTEIYGNVTKYIVDSVERYKARRNVTTDKERIVKIESFIRNANRISTTIKECKKNLIDQLVLSYIPICADVMKRFSPPDEIVTFAAMDQSIRIRIKKTTKLPSGETSDFEASPEEFYNAFRYKLYVVSLKISSLFAYMKMNNCKLPFIMDDVFCASDFDNSCRLEEFVKIVYKSYKDLFGKDDLQLVLLTHDSVVQKAFKEGSRYLDADNNLCVVPHRTSRLFHYESCDEIRKTMSDIDFEPITLII